MEDHTSKSMCAVQSLLGGLIEKKKGDKVGRGEYGDLVFLEESEKKGGDVYN